jgi:hypothetical protein
METVKVKDASGSKYRYCAHRGDAGANALTVALQSVKSGESLGVLGGITGPPCFMGYNYRDLALQVAVVSNLEQLNMIMSHARIGPEIDRPG